MSDLTVQFLGADDRLVPQHARLVFRAATPVVVRADFAGDSEVVWRLYRGLLADGLHATIDNPAVQPEPDGRPAAEVWRDEDPDWLMLVLHGQEGSARLATPARPVARFLARTDTLIPLAADPLPQAVAALGNPAPDTGPAAHAQPAVEPDGEAGRTAQGVTRPRWLTCVVSLS